MLPSWAPVLTIERSTVSADSCQGNRKGMLLSCQAGLVARGHTWGSWSGRAIQDTGVWLLGSKWARLTLPVASGKHETERHVLNVGL